MKPRSKGAPALNEIDFLARLREIGVTEAEISYVGRRPRVTRVTFGETSSADLKKLLAAFEGQNNAALLDGVDDETREKIERRMADRVAYHSS